MEKISLLFTIVILSSCISQVQLTNIPVESIDRANENLYQNTEDLISPKNIALLLPLDSFRNESAAIRDGFITSQFLDNNNSLIRIYNTDKLGSEIAYKKAEQDGAEFIVGPLLKNNIVNISTMVKSTPTLALNFIENNEHINNLFQFALAPEDESTEIAEYAIINDEKKAVVLTPKNEWGDRVYNSFKQRYESLGGRILDHQIYDLANNNFSQIVEILNIDTSNRRYQRLLANIRIPLEFSPRRRQDIDLIFFAATPETASQASPLLRYHFADDPLKTYSTSNIFDPSSLNNNDLEGIVFSDIPFIFEKNKLNGELKLIIEKFWEENSIKNIRFYAMGIDAQRIVNHLFNNIYSINNISGITGNLYLDNTGKIHRELVMVEISNGEPRLIDQ
ncbi:MAG: penicillin-binding protein activator [Pseudomonadota bacterium]|nr:penicillin-binding protein activator [Pseudomonadota bacterium]